MDVVKETLNVAGLLTNVYARSDLHDSDKHASEPVVVLFFLHGRGESADSIDTTARAAFAWTTLTWSRTRLGCRLTWACCLTRAVFIRG